MNFGFKTQIFWKNLENVWILGLKGKNCQNLCQQDDKLIPPSQIINYIEI